MRSCLFALLVAALLPVSATADDAPPRPKYPPGFDCSAVAAGSQRQACNRSQLKPPMGAIPEVKRPQPDSTIRQPTPQRLPTTKPPTIPSLPGTIDNTH